MPYSIEQIGERIDKIHTKIRDNIKQMEEDIKIVKRVINEENFTTFRTNLTTINLTEQEEILDHTADFIEDAKKIIQLEKKRREMAKELIKLENRAKVKKERKLKRLQTQLYRNPYARENSQEKDIGDKESTS